MTTRPDEGGLEISMRLKLLLLSDLISEADAVDDEAEADRLLALPRLEAVEIADHLARQLQLDYAPEADLDGTLLYVAEELDRRARGQGHVDMGLLAESTVEPLRPREVLATAIAGQRAWKSTAIKACTVGTLQQHLKRAIASGLASSLTRLQDQWRAVDLDELHDRREGAKGRIAERQAALQAELEARARPPEVSAETLKAQEEARKRRGQRSPVESWRPSPDKFLGR